MNRGSLKISRIKKNNLRCHSNQTYETSHLNCYVLICLIHIGVLEDVNGGSREISRIRTEM